MPDFVTEAEAIDALSAKLEVMEPELLDTNGYEEGGESLKKGLENYAANSA